MVYECIFRIHVGNTGGPVEKFSILIGDKDDIRVWSHTERHNILNVVVFKFLSCIESYIGRFQEP